MTTPPKEPRAPGTEFEYHRRTAKFNRQRLATGTEGSVTTLGFMPHRAKQVTSVGSSTTVLRGALGLVPRGEWHSNLDYSVNDLVTVSGGDNAGSYYCTEAVLASGPEPGTGSAYMWVKFPGGIDVGIWR